MAGDDKAGENYWETLWEKRALPAAIDPYLRGPKNYPYRKFHRYFQSIFKDDQTEGKKLLEIGCAQSIFLPYFSKYFGFRVYGLDRSQVGCESARAILEREGVDGEVYCADFFSPPRSLEGDFDVVVSYGVIEHFDYTAGCVRTIAGYLKPGGRMFTLVPNLAGALGTLQKILDRAVYDIHVPLDREDVARVHREAGLEVEKCEYFLPLNFGILHIAKPSQSTAFKLAFRAARSYLSKAICLTDDYFPFLRPNRLIASYINCVARKV